MPYIIIGAVIAVLLIYCIASYNKLTSERLKVENQWSQVDIVLKQRADTVPNLVKTVSAFASHEKGVFDSVTASREKYMNAKTPADAAAASAELSGGIARLMAVAENYPELKSNVNFLDLQKQLSSLEGKLADYRQFYNDTVMRYNRQILMFPSSIFAAVFRFEKKDFFAVDETDKAAPNVNFNI